MYVLKIIKYVFGEGIDMKDIKTTPKSIRSLISEIRNNKYNFDLAIQRKFVWSLKEQSLLIDTLLRDYPVYPALINRHSEENLYDVIDSKQRFTTIAAFANNEFKLSKNLKPVVIDGKEYEIAGKKFEDLDEDVQLKFYDRDISIITLTDATPEEIADIFDRVNLGKPLNNSQRRSTVENDEVRDIVKSVATHPFIQSMLSPSQIKNDVDKDIARQTLMLTEKSNEYDFGSFRNNDINKFLTYYNEKISDPSKADEVNLKLENIQKALDRLNEEFVGSEVKINRLTLSFTVYGMYRVYKDSKSTAKYIEWLKNFLNNWGSDDEYMKYCQGGTASAENVNGRLQYFRNAIRNI